MVAAHAATWLVPTLAVGLAVSHAGLGWAGTVITVPVSFAAQWLGYRVGGRVASWRVQLRLIRALRRKP